MRALVAPSPTLDAALKAAAVAAIPFTGTGGGSGRSYTWDGLLPSTKIDFQREAGDLSQSTAVMSCIQWLTRTFPEAPLEVRASLGQAQEVVPNHPVTAMLTRPNPYYSGILLWQATITSLHVAGNAYWLKVRSARGDLLQLWYEPHFTIGPTWDQAGTSFITGYRVNRGGTWYDVATDDVVHFRYGIDPQNPRLGLSPLASALREVFTDNEGANYSASILRNMGIPGLVVSPGTPDGVIDDTEGLKRAVMAKTTGDRRGEPLVMSLPTRIERIAWNPVEMNVREVRRIPEERIAALIGIPAVVVGLGAGLDRCIIANMKVATVHNGPVAIQDITEGTQVWALQGEALAPARVTWSGKTGHREVFRVKTKNRTLTATDNHPFLVRRQELMPAPMIDHRTCKEWRFWLDWVALKDLTVGDVIVAATELPDAGGTTLPDGKPATVALMEWFGAFVGDGCYAGGARDTGLILSIPTQDRVRAHYEALTAPLFSKYAGGGTRPWRGVHDGSTAVMVARHQAGESYHAIARDYSIHNATVRDRVLTATHPKPARGAPVFIQEKRNGFGISSASGSRWVRSLGFARGARTKYIPGWVFSLSAELRMAFLRGLLDTDGSVDKRGHATFTFASERLTADTWHLALSLGMAVSNVYEGHTAAKKLPNPGLQESYTYWNFKLTSNEDVRRIGTHDAKYRAYLDAATEQKNPSCACSYPSSRAVLPAGCMFTRVQSITPAGTEDVYDLTVEGAHNFVAQGLIVHNSTFANARESREAAYESCIVPMQRLLAAELDTQLLPDLGDPATEHIAFDVTQVRALQEDRDKLVARQVLAFNGGLIRRSEGRRAIGLETDAGDEIFAHEIPILRENLTDPTATPVDVANEATPHVPEPSKNGQTAAV